MLEASLVEECLNCYEGKEVNSDLVDKVIEDLFDMEKILEESKKLREAMDRHSIEYELTLEADRKKLRALQSRCRHWKFAAVKDETSGQKLYSACIYCGVFL